MIKLSQICCTSSRMKLRNFNLNKTVIIPQRPFNFVYSRISIFLFIQDFKSTDDEKNSSYFI